MRGQGLLVGTGLGFDSDGLTSGVLGSVAVAFGFGFGGAVCGRTSPISS